jgi:hypothetical protein
MPAALVGLGLGWMFLNRPSASTGQRPGSYDDRGYNMPGYNRGYAASGPLAGAMGSAPSPSENAAERMQDTAKQVVEQVHGSAGQLIGQVQETAEVVMDQVQETGGQVVDQVQEQASRAQSFLQRQLEESPLLVGAVAMVIGGVLAGTVRPTASEDQLLGNTRDRLMGGARQLTQETMDKVGRVVDEASVAAKQEAREQSLVPEGALQGEAG